MKFKKLLSLAVSLAMLLSCIFVFDVTSYATLTGTEKATIKFVPMKQSGSNYVEMTEAEIAALKANDKFFIGVKAVDFSNIQEMSQGLYQVAIGLSFDSNYIKAEPDVRIQNANNLGNAILARTSGVILEDGLYAIPSASTTHLAADDTGINCYYVVLKGTDGYEDLFAKCETDGYLMYLGFAVTAVPEGGAEVFTMTKSPNHYLFQLGTAGAFSLNGDASGSIYVGTHINYDVSDLDFFPVPKEKEPVNEVNVTLTAPVTGDTAKAATAAGTGVASAATVEWKPTLTGNKFTADEAYEATITVKTDGDYKFVDGTTTVKLNGEAITSVTVADESTLKVVKTFDKTDKDTITAIAVNDLTAPESNKAFDTSATATATAKISGWPLTVGSIAWKNADDSAAPANAAPGTVYKAVFTITAPEKTVLAADIASKVTVKGATVSATRTSDTVVTVEATFPATKKEAISAVTLTGVTAPAKGATAPTIGVPAGANYTVASVFDPAVAGSFVGETVYTQTITVTPNAGDSFASSVTVNGIPSGVTPKQEIKDNKLILTITWPETDSIAVKNIAITEQPNLTYKFDDEWDLSGLKVTVTYDNNSTVDVTASDCEITIDGNAIGEKVGTLDATNGKKLTVSYKGQTAETDALTVTEADTTVTIPATLTARPNTAVSINATVSPKDPEAGKITYEYKVEEKGTCSKPDEHTSDDMHDETCGWSADVVERWLEIPSAGLAEGSYTVRASYPASPNTKAATSNEAALTVKNQTGGHGGGSGMLTVRFDAGVNGKITKGSSTVKVARNEKLKSSDIPTVTANEGYRFLGWTLDGSKTVDPTDANVTSSITYKALYNAGATHGAYMRGDNTGMFNPDANITRAEAAALIARLNANYNEGTKYSSSLNDIPADEWYAGVVNFCASSGLITGYDDGTFLPNNQITRQEFCAIVARYLNLSNTGEANFNDIDETIWGAGYISQLAGKGIINGYEDGSFAPNAPIKRCEVVKILNAVFDRTPDRSTVNDNIGNYSVRIPDVSADHWAYYEILEAAIEHEHADFHKN